MTRVARRRKAELFETAWGWMALCWLGDALLRVVLPGSRHLAAREAAGCAGPVEEGAASTLARRCQRYFEGERVEFSAPVELPAASAFRRRVWEVTAQVAYGEVVTYGDVAARAGSAGGARAVGQAMARNPLPLVVPCHRVVAADGTLGGFSAEGGVALKRRMLALEGALDDDGRPRRGKV